MKLLLLYILFFILSSVSIVICQNNSEGMLLGKYVYQQDDMLFESQGRVLFNSYYIGLTFEKEMMVKEDHENFQCFARPMDYEGFYLINDSILTCYVAPK